MCPCGCGLPASVSQDPENEDRFTVDLPVRCHAGTALARAQQQIPEDTPSPRALMWDPPRLR